MGRREVYRGELRALGGSDWSGFLRAHSGLPGPRANLELLQAVADEGDARRFDGLITTDEEYLVACGVVGLGRLLGGGANGEITSRLRSHAADPRWRVREAVAMAVQRLGDAQPQAAARAIMICDRVTQCLADLPAEQRKQSGVRTLRQALGYCWKCRGGRRSGAGIGQFPNARSP